VCDDCGARTNDCIFAASALKEWNYKYNGTDSARYSEIWKEAQFAPTAKPNKSWELPSFDILPEPPARDSGDELDPQQVENVINKILKKSPVTLTDVVSAPTVTIYHVNFSDISDIVHDEKIAKVLSKIFGNTIVKKSKIADVAFEIVRESRQTVDYKTTLRHQNACAGKAFPIALGIDTDGNSVVTDLKKFKSGLVAGTAGSGKSVAIHAILNSILQSTAPDMLDLYLADLKQVELAQYEELPHLATPVIYDMDTLMFTLEGLVRIMTERYADLKSRGLSELPDGEKRILFVLDEVAEAVMMTRDKGKELFYLIGRLLQAGRACGIHVILSTQRPEVKIIPGLLKANLPTVIGMTCKSQMQSKTIIDESGLEKLAGYGDALIALPGKTELIRTQTPYICNDTIAALVDFWKNQA